MLMKNEIVGGAPMQHFPRKKKIKVGGVYGLATNDVDYQVRVHDKDGKQVWRCPYYVKWKGMIQRCYSPVFHKKYPTYKDCTVCDEWLLFSNFREWMGSQDWEGKDIDKDIIGLDGQYSPENCRFIGHDLNLLLNDHAAKRGDYPQGVYLFKATGKYQAQISINSKRKFLGLFLTIQEASNAYILAKRQYILEYAYKQTDVALKNGLLRHANNLTMDTNELLSKRRRQNCLRERVMLMT